MNPTHGRFRRIVSGAAAGATTGQWLTAGHRRAKTITNSVANRWGDGPDTPAGVRDRIARQGDPALQELVDHTDDETIAAANDTAAAANDSAAAANDSVAAANDSVAAANVSVAAANDSVAAANVTVGPGKVGDRS